MAVKYELPFTQTSTMVAFMCTLLVAVALTLRFEAGEGGLLGSLVSLLHLGSFSTWLGVQVWVTFFAGNGMMLMPLLFLLMINTCSYPTCGSVCAYASI